MSTWVFIYRKKSTQHGLIVDHMLIKILEISSHILKLYHSISNNLEKCVFQSFEIPIMSFLHIFAGSQAKFKADNNQGV